jgi:hypothetical protein
MKVEINWIGFRWSGIFDRMTVDHKYGKVNIIVVGPITITIWSNKNGKNV